MGTFCFLMLSSSKMTNNFKPEKGGYKKPQLSPDEWKEKKQAEKDAVYQMIDETATAIVQDGDKFRAFLDTQARLDRYSILLSRIPLV